MTHARSQESGFTLVEMLVALAIFALLAAGGVSILRASVDTQSSVDRQLRKTGELGRLHALMSSDLAQAVHRATRAASGERAAFEGGASGMRFVRAGWTNLDQESRSDLQRVEWSFDGSSLVRTGFARLDGEAAAPRPAPFARNLAGADFRYRMPDGSWSGAFTSSEESAMPTAVEVTLRPAEGPPLVMVFALLQDGIAAAETLQ